MESHKCTKAARLLAQPDKELWKNRKLPKMGSREKVGIIDVKSRDCKVFFKYIIESNE